MRGRRVAAKYVLELMRVSLSLVSLASTNRRALSLAGFIGGASNLFGGGVGVKVRDVRSAGVVCVCGFASRRPRRRQWLSTRASCSFAAARVVSSDQERVLSTLCRYSGARDYLKKGMVWPVLVKFHFMKLLSDG